MIEVPVGKSDGVCKMDFSMRRRCERIHLLKYHCELSAIDNAD